MWACDHMKLIACHVKHCHNQEHIWNVKLHHYPSNTSSISSPEMGILVIYDAYMLVGDISCPVLGLRIGELLSTPYIYTGTAHIFKTLMGESSRILWVCLFQFF